MNQPVFLRRPLPYRFYNVTVVLIALNILVFILGQFWKVYIPFAYPGTNLYLGLIPELVVERGYVWQIATYMFVHGSFSHILFNMLGLFVFGVQLERRMGSTEFLLYYLFAGIGTGLFSLAINMSVVGASGAIYALLLGFATYFPDARIFILGILPMRAPIAVLVFTVLSLVFQFTGVMGGVAHLGHLAGVVLGFVYFFVRLGINPVRVFLHRR